LVWARSSIVALALGFGALQTQPVPSFAQAAPVATAASSPNCALVTLPEDHVKLQDSFSHSIVEVPTLRFFALIFHATSSVQRKMFALASKPVNRRTLNSLGATVAEACAGEEIAYRAARAEVLLLSSWTKIATDDQNFANLENSLLVAVASLAVRSQLATSDVDAALAPFGTTLGTLDAAPSPSAAAPGCPPDADAKVLRPTQPEYPMLAVAKRASGLVKIRVTLDDQGLVEEADVFDAPSGDAGVEALENESVVAAASSTYAAQIKECKAVSGSYLFNAQFDSK
jgi:hypothetical protein